VGSNFVMIHSQEDLAKFGYRSDMKVETKVERFQTRGPFWRLVVLNMAISKNNSFSCDYFETFLFHVKKSFVYVELVFLFVFRMPKLPKEKTIITKIQGCFAQLVDI
jgi:hypothetical protein